MVGCATRQALNGRLGRLDGFARYGDDLLLQAESMRKLAEEVGVDFLSSKHVGIWWGYGDFKWEFYGGLMGIACVFFLIVGMMMIFLGCDVIS